MPTLYVENVPEDLYQALRERARSHRKSIAAEILSLLEENIPTAEEIGRRRQFLERARELRSRPSRVAGPFSATEEMQREDRER